MALTDSEIKIEWLACSQSPLYFIHNYCQIYDAVSRTWQPFKLWPRQVKSLKTLEQKRLVIIVKARQLGLTWLVLGYALWHMLFRPVANVLLFNKGDSEAMYMLSEERLRGMYRALPRWMQARRVDIENEHVWQLSNQSIARALPPNRGDALSASIVIGDEADLYPDFNAFMTRVKPTIDAGGQMILLSRVDKDKPESEFKKIYLAAKEKFNEWTPIFLPWHARPNRTQEWYETQSADVFHRTGSLDDLHEQYPATDTEALAPRTLNKRLAPAWLEACYQPEASLEELPADAPAIPGLVVYRLPDPSEQYVIGADPAEGNPTSDDSSLTVLNASIGEECAKLKGKYEPSTFGSHIHEIGYWFNQANALVERNNHGHAVLLWLRDYSSLHRLPGLDGKEGFQTNSHSKTQLYDQAADALREGDTVIHSMSAFIQLSSIEGSTLRAPEGQMDDEAMSYVLALAAKEKILDGQLVF